MPHWFDIATELRFAKLTDEVMEKIGVLQRAYEDIGEDACTFGLTSKPEGTVLEFECHAPVDAMKADAIIAAVEALGPLTERGTMVKIGFDDESARYAIGTSEHASQQYRLRDAAERSAALLIEAMPESTARNSLGERVDKQTIARALQALFTDKHWSIVTRCHEDAEMRSQSFLVEGTWAQAIDLVDEYVNAVEAGEIAPGDDVPDPDFQVVEGYDAYGILLQLANCLDEPDLSRHDLEEMRQRNRAESKAGE